MKAVFGFLSTMAIAGLLSFGEPAHAADAPPLSPSKVSKVSMSLSGVAKSDADKSPQFWPSDALTAFRHYVWHHNNDNSGFPEGASVSVHVEITGIRITPLPDRTLFVPADEITATYTITSDLDGQVLARDSASATNKARALDASRMRQLYRALIMWPLERIEP